MAELPLTQQVSARRPYRGGLLALAFGLVAALSGQAPHPAPVAVVSAASFKNVVAPDSLASLFGVGLTDRVAQAGTAPGSALPLELDGVTVLIGERPAGLIYVSPSQINLWLPPDTPVGTSAVEVRNARTGALAKGSISVSSVAPGVFSADCLRPDTAAILNGINFAREPFSTITRSTPGDDKRTRLSIFGTGIRNAASVEALIVDPAGRQVRLQVEYAGPAPNFFGLDQVNVVLTPDLEGLGVATLRLLVDGAESNAVSVRLAQAELLDATLRPYSIETYEARLQTPAGVAVDRAGNLYIADTANHAVRRVDLLGRISTVAGNGAPGASGDGGPAAEASLNAPTGVAVSPAGDLFIADRGNHKIRRVSRSGRISTFAGTGQPGSLGDEGPAVQARLSSPSSVTVDALSNVVIADTGNHAVRRVTADGWIARLAGSGRRGFAGDGGSALLADLDSPTSVAVGDNGSLYMADAGNFRVRRVSLDGSIRTVAGSGEQGAQSRPCPALEAKFGSPLTLSVDPLGQLLIADPSNHRVYSLGGDCTLEPIAGLGERGFSGDGGAALVARLASPSGVAANGVGEVFVADSANGRIRRLERSAPRPLAACGQVELLSVTPRHAIAGQTVTAAVRLTCPADFDTMIALRSEGLSAAMPSTVVIPAGRTTTAFELVLPAVEAATAARIVATTGAVEAGAVLTALPSGAGLILTLEASTITGGESALGIVTLGAPASPGGVDVVLTSADAGVARTANTATVPEGQTQAAFLISTNQVDRAREIQLTAAAGASTATAPLTVLPSGGPQIVELTITPNPAQAGSAAMGRITLSAPAGPGGQLVRIVSDAPAAVSVPESVVILAGETVAEFPISTTPSPTPKTVTIAVAGPNELRRELLIQPETPTGPLARIRNLDVLPNPLTAGQSGNALVTLAAPAPEGGVRLLLSASGEAVSVPPSMTIPEGETRAFFRVRTNPVAATTTAVVWATSANSLGATVTVIPSQ